jgi:hypothetical protein
VADWYVSSATYASVPTWAASTAYTVGQFIKPLTAPAVNLRYVYRCTVAGTTAASEPSWASSTGNNQTVVSGGATFTNVSGQSAYGWSAAAGSLVAISNSRPAVGDRVFLSSDHSESHNIAYNFNGAAHAFGSVQIISINRAGSIPPVTADLQSGAGVGYTQASGSGGLVLEAYCGLFWHGVTFTVAGTGVGINLYFNTSARRIQYLKNCAIVITTTIATARIITNGIAKVVLDNTTVQFGAVGQAIGPNALNQMFDLEWINTPSAIQGATVPTNLFNVSGGCGMTVTCRGVDLSAITTTLCTGPASASGPIKALFDSCKIAPGVVRLASLPAASSPTADLVELVNCYDGTNVVNERYGYNGNTVFDRATYLDSVDDIGGFSAKLTSSTRTDFQNFALGAFQFDVGNTVVGSSKTATIEVLSAAALNDTDFRMVLQYMGTSGSPIASFGENLSSVLMTGSALPSSSAAWNGTLPPTPNKQKLQVTFTPQRAGRVRGLVRLGKPSATVWVNPQVTIS